MSINREVFNIVQFLKSVLTSSGQKGFALGVSGGIDSAVCAALAKRAIDELHLEDSTSIYPTGRTYKLDLIMLPMSNAYGDDRVVAEEVIESLGVEGRSVELGDAYRAFLAGLHPTADGHDQPDLKSAGNLKARMRMAAIYYSANVNGLLVLGTDNRSETYTGYFTKHGDGAADVFPLSDYTKREVYEMGRFLKLPETVLVRTPSADLWDGQTDEGEMGIPYDYIDNHLEGMYELNERTYGREQSEEFRRKLSRLHTFSEHKRAAPLVYRRSE